MSITAHDLDAYLEQLREALSSSTNCSLEAIGSLVLRLEDRPFTMRDHFPLRPLLNKQLPQRTVIKAGRQIGKSTSVSAACVLRAFALPHFKIMIVTPLKSQVTNISNNYIKPFIVTSPLHKLLVDPKCVKSTLYKEFKNGSRIILMYALLDVARTRSYPNDLLVIDETQDFDIEHIPVIRETLTASKWRLELFTGTPLSRDGTLEQLWEESSQCELVIKCTSCGFWNIPALEHHLVRMIGPLRDDISERRPATVCAKCGVPINPRQGKWVARHPDRHKFSAGYHVPQIIMPMHYANFSRWRELLDKQAGKGPTPLYRFINEVLGESYDESVAIITSKDLAAAAKLGENSIENALRRRPAYRYCALGVDWGGGGRSGLSLTTIAFAGLTASGNIEISFAERIVTETDPKSEARRIVHIFRQLMPTFIAHDYTGAGNVREAYLVEWGISEQQLAPMYFLGTSTNFMIVPTLMTAKNRTYYKMDKTKAYQFVCAAIKEGKILFFDGELDAGQKLLNDFLVLREERHYTPSGRESYRIIKGKNACDDFAAATAMACVALWHATGMWPALTTAAA